MGKKMETAILKGIVSGTTGLFLDSLLTRGKLRVQSLMFGGLGAQGVKFRLQGLNYCVLFMVRVSG